MMHKITSTTWSAMRDGGIYAAAGAASAALYTHSAAGQAALVLAAYAAVARIIMEITRPIFHSLGAHKLVNGEPSVKGLESFHVAHATFSHFSAGGIVAWEVGMTAAEMAALVLPTLALIAAIFTVGCTAHYLLGQHETVQLKVV